MKKIIALILAILMMMSLAACGEKAPDENSTVGEHLVYDFKNNVDMSVSEIADLLISNEILSFVGIAIPVEEGYLAGFDNFDIKGFEEGVMFGPTINTIPFIGYIFELEKDTDVEQFMQDIRNNANLRWNICTEAEQLIVENKGDKVIVIMGPEKFEEENATDAQGDPVEDQMPVYGGEENVDEFEDGLEEIIE